MHVFAGFDRQLHRVWYNLNQFTIDPSVNLEKICSVLNLKIKKYIFTLQYFCYKCIYYVTTVLI